MRAAREPGGKAAGGRVSGPAAELPAALRDSRRPRRQIAPAEYLAGRDGSRAASFLPSRPAAAYTRDVSRTEAPTTD